MRTDTQRVMDQQEVIDIDCYRKAVKNFIELRRYQTALFWAEKVSTMSDGDPFDVYWVAQCMFLLREFHRAAHIICSRGLEKTNLLCHYLAAECLTEAKEYQGALTILNAVNCETLPFTMNSHFGMNASNMKDDSAGEDNSSVYEDSCKHDIIASLFFLKGKVLEAMDNRVMAMDCYVLALHKSVYCTEALDALVQHDMLMAWEEKELIQHIPMGQQCTEAEKKILKRLYESKLKKYYESISTYPDLEHPPVPSMNSSLWYEMKEKLKNIKNNAASKAPVPKTQSAGRRQKSKHIQIMAPANKILEDLKNTPSYLIHTSLTKASLLGASISPGSSLLSSGGANSSRQETSFRINRPPKAVGPSVISLTQCMNKIELSIDMLVARAEKYFYNCDYRRCIKTLEDVLKNDPYHKRALTVQIGCLAEMKNFNRLFYVAHKLVDFHPDDAIAWYAVGCYYDLIGKSDPARRYLSKATTLDRRYSPAWLAYGHSFAKENEHDQAMAAYFKATQLMRGCHLPLLYIGVECGLTKNPEMAEKFFYQAMSIAPLDVFVLHELGVIKFDYEQYESAEEVFRSTLEMVRAMAKQNNERVTARWEPLINNLGHCCRKNKKYEEALEFHQWALSLKPLNALTYTAIGFVQALMGELAAAVDAFHKSLSLKRDDVFTTTILKYVIEDLAEEQTHPFFSAEGIEQDGDANFEGTNNKCNATEEPSTAQNLSSISCSEDIHGATRPTLRMQLNFDDWYTKTPPMSDTSVDEMSIDI